jgi:hypothetical protein
MARLTTNFNFLSPTGFRLTINRNRFANVEYFITGFSIPSISMGEVTQGFRGHTSFQAGDTVGYDALSIRFAIDEDMKNYTEIFDWMINNRESGRDPLAGDQQVSDMILTVLTNHNNVNKEFQFMDAFPTSLSGAEFTTQATDVEYLQADVTFRYNEFKIIK